MVYSFVNNLPFEEGIARHCEKIYLKGIISHLQRMCETELEIHFYIGVTNLKISLQPSFVSKQTKKACIIIDEFLDIQPQLLNQFDVVFQAYIQHNELPKNYFHFPLGYTENLKEVETKPINERTLDVFFSGSLHTGRIKFFKEVSFIGFLPYRISKKIQKKFKFKYDNYFPNAYIRFTNGFMSGLSGEDYTKMLNNSKIVLCPAGVSKIESFRIFEALKMGNVLIADQLPDKLNFKNSPIIQVQDWRGLKDMIVNFLENNELLENTSKESRSFYDSNFSENAMAEKIIDSVSGC